MSHLIGLRRLEGSSPVLLEEQEGQEQVKGEVGSWRPFDLRGLSGHLLHHGEEERALRGRVTTG